MNTGEKFVIKACTLLKRKKDGDRSTATSIKVEKLNLPLKGPL